MGTTERFGTKNIAVPGTLLIFLLFNSDKNLLSFTEPSQRAANIRSRPVIQLNIIVSNPMAITIGNQPPSKNFIKFEERKTTSIISRPKNKGIKIRS